MCPREQNCQFLGNWCKISVLKMKVAAIMEPTVALFSYFINDLRLRVQGNLKKRCHKFFYAISQNLHKKKWKENNSI